MNWPPFTDQLKINVSVLKCREIGHCYVLGFVQLQSSYLVTHKSFQKNCNAKGDYGSY